MALDGNDLWVGIGDSGGVMRYDMGTVPPTFRGRFVVPVGSSTTDFLEAGGGGLVLAGRKFSKLFAAASVQSSVDRGASGANHGVVQKGRDLELRGFHAGATISVLGLDGRVLSVLRISGSEQQSVVLPMDLHGALAVRIQDGPKRMSAVLVLP